MKQSAAIASEREIVGSMVTLPDLLDGELAEITVEDFTVSLHKMMFGMAKTMREQQLHMDRALLESNLSTDLKILDRADQIIEGASCSNLTYHVKAVKDKTRIRQMIQYCSDVTAMVRRGSTSDEVLEDMQNKVFAMSVEEDHGNEIYSMEDVLREVVKESRLRGGLGQVGFNTGFRDLDNLPLLLKPGQMCIIGGRPSDGKTSLAVNILEHIADAGHPTMLFSKEMTEMEIGARVMARRMKYEGDMDRVVSISKGLPLYVTAPYKLTIGNLKAMCRKAALQKKIEVFAVDYLQILDMAGGESRNLQVAHATAEIKSLARELNVPIILLSQLRRMSSEMRGGQRPIRNDDLRDSGAIEQDADVIMMIHRRIEEHAAFSSEDMIALAVSKNRNGPRGVVPLSFDAEHTAFSNYDGVVPSWLEQLRV